MSFVLGVDACKAGWIGISLDHAGHFHSAQLARGIVDLVSMMPVSVSVTVIGVDMPIGLPDQGERQADALARKRIGALSSSVFMVPTRTALAAEQHPEASVINKSFDGGKGISIQAWGLKSKLLEVDAWVRASPSARVVEVHPEVSFAAMGDAPLTTSKKSWAGIADRHQLLSSIGIHIPHQLGDAGRAAADDVLDAGAAAWSAYRVARGQAVSLPSEPEVFSDGLSAAIWY
jgi:predicted RNase H-like nuclease